MFAVFTIWSFYQVKTDRDVSTNVESQYGLANLTCQLEQLFDLFP